jgi:P2-related tail formation protein
VSSTGEEKAERTLQRRTDTGIAEERVVKPGFHKTIVELNQTGEKEHVCTFQIHLTVRKSGCLESKQE